MHDSAVTIATAMMLKNGLDFPANFLVRRLHGSGCTGVVVVASRNVKDGIKSAGCRGLWFGKCRRSFPEVGLGSGAENNCGLFKNVILRLEQSVFASQGAQGVHCGPIAYGSGSFATDLHSLRLQLPLIKQVAADAEFFGDLSNRLSSADKFYGLGFELRTITLTGFIIHIGFL